MKKLFILLAILLNHNAFGQVILETEIQKASNQKIGAINSIGMKSNYGTFGPSSNLVMGRFEITKLQNNGLVIRNDYSFTKYDEDMNKQWTTEIKSPFGGAVCSNTTMGDETGLYLILEKSNTKEFAVIKIENDGTYKQHVNSPTSNCKNTAYYLTGSGLNIVTIEINKKENKYNYKLQNFATNLALSEKPIALTQDAYETENYKEGFGMTWAGLKTIDNKIILSKRYFINYNKPNQRIILKTVELNGLGVVSNEITWPFTSTETIRTFPLIDFSDDGKSMYLFNYLSVIDKDLTNGLYVYKINYTTHHYDYKKKILFDNIVNGISIKDIHHSFDEIYPTSKLIEGVYELKNNNGNFNFLILKSQKTSLSNSEIYSINLDSTGTVTSMYQNTYPANPFICKRYSSTAFPYNLGIIDNGGFFLNPLESKELFSTEKSNTIISPLEFIFQHANEKADVNKFWCVRPAQDYNLLLQISDGDSEIIAYKLKK